MEEFDDSIAQTNLGLHTPKQEHIWLSFVLIFVGAGLLTGGAELLVRGATAIALYAGVSERLIAITLVSAGTGLPELTTAIIAGARKHPSVAIGNVIGSNIFNVLGILGTVALVRKVPASPQIIQVDALWMLGFSALLLVPLFKPSRRLTRFEGIVLLAAYGFYIYTIFVYAGDI